MCATASSTAVDNPNLMQKSLNIFIIDRIHKKRFIIIIINILLLLIFLLLLLFLLVALLLLLLQENGESYIMLSCMHCILRLT